MNRIIEAVRAVRLDAQPAENRQAWYRQQALSQAQGIMNRYRVSEKLQLIPDRQDLFQSYFAGYLVRKLNYEPSNTLNNPLVERLATVPGVRRLYRILENKVTDQEVVAQQFMQEADQQARTIKDAADAKARENIRQLLRDTSLRVNPLTPADEEYIKTHQEEMQKMMQSVRQHPLYQSFIAETAKEEQVLLEEMQNLMDNERNVLLREHGTPEAILRAANLISTAYTHDQGLSTDERVTQVVTTISSIQIIGN